MKPKTNKCEECDYVGISPCIEHGAFTDVVPVDPKVEEMRGQLRYLVAENKRLSGTNKGLMRTMEHLSRAMDSITHVQEAKRASTIIKAKDTSKAKS